MAGVPKTAEHRSKISAARKGQKKSLEHKEKLRLAAIRQFSDPDARARAAEYGARARRKLVTPTGVSWYVFSVYRDRLKRRNLPKERYEMILSWLKIYVYGS